MHTIYRKATEQWMEYWYTEWNTLGNWYDLAVVKEITEHQRMLLDLLDSVCLQDRQVASKLYSNLLEE